MCAPADVVGYRSKASLDALKGVSELAFFFEGDKPSGASFGQLASRSPGK